MRLKPALTLFITCCYVLIASAQQFGGNPASLKWKQIDTDTARIIFPEGVEPTANRVATVIHHLQKQNVNALGGKLRKVNIVLQNQTTLANGYVGLGPWRSEFYLFAPQNSFEQGSLNWADKLAVHEYRHVEQYTNFNVGLSKAASLVLGQEGQALANSAAIPDYFFEGDAVVSETALTEQGRGRQPLFLNGYQSLYRHNKNYSYTKLRNGSLKHYVPDHYQLGYLLVGYGRQKYGNDFWAKVTADAARFKPLLYPWQGAIKKYSGIGYKQFVDDAFNYYQAQWQKSSPATFKYVTPKQEYPTDYKYPAVAGAGKLLVLKRSYRQIPVLSMLDSNGSERKIAIRGIAYDDYFSANDKKIVYATLKPDARWSYREYSNINLIDISTGRSVSITQKQRLVSPDISHNGRLIVAVEMTTSQLSNLIVMDTLGNRVFRLNGKPGDVYTYPRFSANDSFLFTAVRNARGDMAMQKISLQNSQVKNVIPFSDHILGLPTVQGDTVYFTSTFKGSDEVWAFAQNKEVVYRIADLPGGLYHPVYDPYKKQLIASMFTADGYRLVSFDRDDLRWQKVDLNAEALPDLYIPAALAVDEEAKINSIAPRDFNVKKYSRAFNLFNLHSWRPYYDQPELSFTVFGQNILNTFRTDFSYTYNYNESSHRAGANFIYGGWYVQPFVNVNKTWNRTIRYNRDTTIYYNENDAGLGLSLPLNLSGNRHFTYLNFSSSINTRQIRVSGPGKALYNNADFNFLQNRVTFTNQVQKAVQHIFPRWAQTISINYRNIINQYTARQFLATGNVYLPGITPTQNLVLNAGYAARDTMNQYFFSNNFPFSRGYTSVDFPRMFRLGLNYHFTLLYPDWGFGHLVYFKRLRANTFYDLTQGKSLRTGKVSRFNTVGAELFFDTKWWNQQDVSFGLRYSRLLNPEFRGATNPNQWQIILPVGLFTQ